MALPMTLIVITGEIDLSVASMLGLSSAAASATSARTAGRSGRRCWSPCWSAPLGGAFNGVLVTRARAALDRGHHRHADAVPRPRRDHPACQARSASFPTYLTNDRRSLRSRDTQIACSVGIFLVLAVIFGVVLHATPSADRSSPSDCSTEAALFSGIRVNRIKFMLYVLSGVVCAFAGILLTFRLSSARSDNGTGLELNAVAIVLLGGVSIFGGRGTILGVVLAAAVMACFLESLTLINVSAQVQNIVTGGLLLLSVVVPTSGDTVRRFRAWLARRRAAAAAAATIQTAAGEAGKVDVLAGVGSANQAVHEEPTAGGLPVEGGGIADPGD